MPVTILQGRRVRVSQSKPHCSIKGGRTHQGPGGLDMATVLEKKIVWETSLEAALRKARLKGKTVLLDFYNPG